MKLLYPVFPYHNIQMVLTVLCKETIMFMFEKANGYNAWERKTVQR